MDRATDVEVFQEHRSGDSAVDDAPSSVGGAARTIEYWRRMADGLTDACRVVEDREARKILNIGLSRWLADPGPRWTKIDLFGGNRTIGLIGRMEKSVRDVQEQGEELAKKLIAVDQSEAIPLAKALDDLALAWGHMLAATEMADKALRAARAVEPSGAEALGAPLSQKLSAGRGEFASFATAAREAWHECGEVLRGGGSSYEFFLDRVHQDIQGTTISSRGQLLAEMRNGYYKKKFRWK